MRERLNFRRRAFLCTTLYRNLMQASNFGGTFDQLFLWIFLWTFHRRCLSTFLYHGAKKSKMTKNSNQGDPALINKINKYLLCSRLKAQYPTHRLQVYLHWIGALQWLLAGNGMQNVNWMKNNYVYLSSGEGSHIVQQLDIDSVSSVAAHVS